GDAAGEPDGAGEGDSVDVALGEGEGCRLPPNRAAQFGSAPVSQSLLNWIQASLARSSAVASVTAPGVPSTTVTFWPVFTRTTPCGVCTATTPSSTMIVVDPSGCTSTANTVPCTEPPTPLPGPLPATARRVATSFPAPERAVTRGNTPNPAPATMAPPATSASARFFFATCLDSPHENRRLSSAPHVACHPLY